MLTRMSRFLAVTAVTAATAASWAGVASAAARPAVSDPNLFASVSQSGTLLAGSPGTTVTNIGTGRYEVTFPQNVSNCAYVATTVNAYSQALQAFVASGHLSADGVYVETKNQGGGLDIPPGRSTWRLTAASMTGPTRWSATPQTWSAPPRGRP